MFISVNGTAYELNTKLGTAMAIEKKYKLPMMQIFEKLESAEIGELVEIISISAKQPEAEFRDALLADWDYSDLFAAVQQLCAGIMFSGTPEQTEAKIEKYPVSEERKNALRAMLGLPEKEPPASTGNG